MIIDISLIKLICKWNSIIDTTFSIIRYRACAIHAKLHVSLKMDAGTSNLLSQKWKKSPIWVYLAFEVDEQGHAIDEKHLRCRVSGCKKTIAYSGNATNLHQHMEKWLHKEGSRSNQGHLHRPPLKRLYRNL